MGEYIQKKRDIYTPLIQPANNNYMNYLMLGYYRNPLNHIFYNEGVIIVSMLSFGYDQAFSKDGVSIAELFSRACFLSDLLKKEEVLKSRITEKARHVFD